MTDLRRARTTCEKITETLALILTWISLGMYLEIFGPTLKDLILRLDSNYEHVALAISGRTFGWILGSIMGGFLVDKFGLYRHLIITIAVLTAAIATAVIPWLQDITVLWIFCFIGGVCEQVVNIAGTSVTLSIWEEQAASALIILHMGYGIGSFIVPLYTNPFLAETRPLLVNESNPGMEVGNMSDLHSVLQNVTPSNLSDDVSQSVLNWLNFSEHNFPESLNRTAHNSSLKISEEKFEVIKESRIEYAYTIAAVSLFLCAVMFLFYQIKESRDSSDEGNARLESSYSAKVQPPRDEKSVTLLQMINPATCADGRFWYGLKIFVLIFVFMGNLGGCERVIGSFVRSFAIDQLHFSSADASLLNTSFWISFSIGRLVFAIVAKWISIRVLIIIETLGMALVAALLNIFAADNSTSLWVLMQPIGFLGAPLWPTGVAFTDYHLKLTGVGMTVQILGASAGGIVHLNLIGYLYENFGPRTFLYQLVGSGCVGLLIAILLDIVGAKHGSRYKTGGKTNDNASRHISDSVEDN